MKRTLILKLKLVGSIRRQQKKSIDTVSSKDKRAAHAIARGDRSPLIQAQAVRTTTFHNWHTTQIVQ